MHKRARARRSGCAWPKHGGWLRVHAAPRRLAPRCDANTRTFLQCVTAVKDATPEGFAAVKVTALGDPQLRAAVLAGFGARALCPWALHSRDAHEYAAEVARAARHCIR